MTEPAADPPPLPCVFRLSHCSDQRQRIALRATTDHDRGVNEMDDLAIIYPLMFMTFGAAIAFGLWSRRELKRDMADSAGQQRRA